VPATEAEALGGAAGEALRNVTAHAGVRHAAVTARGDGSGGVGGHLKSRTVLPVCMTAVRGRLLSCCGGHFVACSSPILLVAATPWPGRRVKARVAARPGHGGLGQDYRAARRMESVRRALRRCAVIISLGAAPCRDESRDRASANRSPESFINGLVFTLKGLTLAR
jgi:hypothetical protein